MRQGGFSLIELLIVVAIILVIASIAIPDLLKARMAANEASAVSSIRTILAAQVGYAAAFPATGYADNLTKLAFPPPGQPVDENAGGFLDWVLGCAAQPCPKSGYNFAILDATGGLSVDGFRVTAVPENPGVSGKRGFCSDATGIITVDPDGGSDCTENFNGALGQ